MFDDEMTLDKHLTGVSGEMSASAEPPLNISDPGEYQEDTSENMQTTAPDEATDPITEADVYLAYGRVQQAEDVLHAALRDDPENLAVRTKLLRLYHAEGNAEAFESAARIFREAFPEDDSQWEKIAAMGNDLSPGNELYRLEKPEAGDVADMGLSGLEEVSLQDIVTEDEGAGTGAFDDQLPDELEFAMDDAIEDEIESEGLLASSDEVATKLDLARAYLDMEDPEGARSILQEVLEEGNEEQKNEAESLISKIA